MLLDYVLKDGPLLHTLVDRDFSHPVHVLERVDITACKKSVRTYLLSFLQLPLVETLYLLLTEQKICS